MVSLPSCDQFSRLVKLNKGINVDAAYKFYIDDPSAWGDVWVCLIVAFMQHKEVSDQCGGFTVKSHLAELTKWVNGGCWLNVPELALHFGD
jgi:hypothetical protein